jgi:hypothetical protein
MAATCVSDAVLQARCNPGARSLATWLLTLLQKEGSLS